MVGLRQIDQFKVEAKGARQQQRAIDGQLMHQGHGVRGMV
jgi:hypothetical protein